MRRVNKSTEGPGTTAPRECLNPAQEVVELQLLLPRSQAMALEEAAQSRGMTTGQLLRRVISDLFVAGPAVTDEVSNGCSE